MNSKITTQKIVLTALFAALTAVATMIIKIPTPGTGGYIHFGDAFVILSGIILGPVYGAIAAAIGSALSDLIFGYVLYIPATFVIKGLVAFVSGIIFKKLKIKNSIIKCVICGIPATLIVGFGYLIYEYFFYGEGAIASFPANIIQGLSGLIISSMLITPLNKALQPFKVE